MTDEQRLQAITEQLLIVRDNLFRGMSKSIQKLQARSINEVLELPNFTESPQRTWVGLTESERNDCLVSADPCETLAKPEAEQLMEDVEAMLRNKNT